MLKSVADSGESSMADYPVLKASPLYIQQSLLFPYSQGTMFFNAVYHKLGKAAFAEVFTHPPVNSAQIIHPEKYFAHEKPTEPALPKLTQRRQRNHGWFDGRIRSSDASAAVSGRGQSGELAPHLRGGQFRIVMPQGHDGKPVLLYAAEWDSPHSANEYFAAYRKILQAKWRRCVFSEEKPTMIAGSGDNGYFVVWLSGNIVSSVEGLRTTRNGSGCRALADFKLH